MLPDGYISRGLGALARLAALAAPMILTEQEERVNETYRLFDTGLRLRRPRAIHRRQDHGVTPWPPSRRLGDACDQQYLIDDGDFFDALWQVVNWADVAARLAAARRLDA